MPERTGIRYTINGREVEVDLRGTELRITGGALIVLPRAANSISIRMAP